MIHWNDIYGYTLRIWIGLSHLVDVRAVIDAFGYIAYYVSFGPHGTRHPVTKPGESNKIVLGVLAALGATGLLWTTIRSYGEQRRISKEVIINAASFSS
jgi:hypothetical protein